VTARDHHHRARAELGDAYRLAGFAGGVLLLHVLGWGLFLAYAPHHPAFAGLGVVTWAAALLIWRVGRIEERWGRKLAPRVEDLP